MSFAKLNSNLVRLGAASAALLAPVVAFAQEARASARINHPNAIDVYDVGESEDGGLYLVMELHGTPWQPPAAEPAVPEPRKELRPAAMQRRTSCDLFECIEQHSRLTEEQARWVFAQVVETVWHLDRICICHRDIKDENCVVDAEFNVKLIDFGSAVITDVRKPQPYFNRFFGTMTFASPEILQGKPYRAPHAEIWSLGVLLSILLSGQCPFPDPAVYEGFAMHEDGVGMARTFELEFLGRSATATGPQEGFFAWADATTPEPVAGGGRYEAAGDYAAPAEGYRAVRTGEVEEPSRGGVAVALRPRPGAPTAVLTSEAGAAVIGPLVASLGLPSVRVLPVANEFFGGTTSVTGLLVGEDLRRVLAGQPEAHRYLLPDVCLSGGRFLDGTTPDDLPRPVEIIPTDGAALRRALEA